MRIKKILIIATRQIGDTLITTPMISAAKKIWPEAKIDFFGYVNSLTMLSGNSEVHRLIGTKPRPKLKDYLKQFFQLFQRYDLAIITQPSDRAYIYGILAARNRVGIIPNESKLNWWKKKVNLHSIEVDYFSQHVITEKIRLLEIFTSQENLFDIPIHVTAPAIKEVPLEIQQELQEPYIVIHPNPLTAYKRWPTQKWKELIEKLSPNYQIILSSGPAPQDKKLNEEIISLLTSISQKKVINLNGSLGLDQLGAILRGANLYIGVDTSVTHLAAACNTPTITLFGATPPTNFGPWPNGFIGKQPYQLKQQIQCIKNVTIIQGPGECVPCRKAGCEDRADSKSDCLINLPTEWVLSAAKHYGINF